MRFSLLAVLPAVFALACGGESVEAPSGAVDPADEGTSSDETGDEPGGDSDTTGTGGTGTGGAGTGTGSGTGTGGGETEADEPLECAEVSPCGQTRLAYPHPEDAAIDLDVAQRCALQLAGDMSDPESTELSPIYIDLESALATDSPSSERLTFTPGSSEVLVQTHGYLNGSGPYVDPLQSCQLNVQEYFTGCLDTPTAGCLNLSNWYTDCVDVPNQCP